MISSTGTSWGRFTLGVARQFPATSCPSKGIEAWLYENFSFSYGELQVPLAVKTCAAANNALNFAVLRS